MAGKGDDREFDDRSRYVRLEILESSTGMTDVRLLEFKLSSERLLRLPKAGGMVP